MAVKAKRTEIVIKADRKRVLIRPFWPATQDRTKKIIARIMALTDREIKKELAWVLNDFEDRHKNLRGFFHKRFEHVAPLVPGDRQMSEEQKLLIGAYFTNEYSIESAALFNPSMVRHPDQSKLVPGALRFVLALRATGEGHISSITFRSGIMDQNNRISLDEPTRYVTAPEVVPDPSYDRALFEQNSNYQIQFSPEQNLSERIIFPTTAAEINGIEDARFVEFCDESGEITYYAPYTAFDGKSIIPQLLETRDFLHFCIHTLNGPAVENKNLALFPRKINGRFAMISRQDNENIFIMFSDRMHFWHSKAVLLEPVFPWEFVQIGCCGSPIETDAGWLVLSHGVGPMRKYTISAFLLDLNDPTKVIGRLKEPLLTPDENEREGYVPNVVYSCGGLVHNGDLIIPYAMSDYASSIAAVNLAELLDELLSSERHQ